MSKKLSAVQEAALEKMAVNQWYSAYELRVRLTTLEALTNRGLLMKRLTTGYIFSPRTAILFYKKERDNETVHENDDISGRSNKEQDDV